MSSTDLKKYGLTARFENEAAMFENLYIARVTEQHRDLYKVISESGSLHAEISGKMIYGAEDGYDYPAVGDWVMIDRKENKSGNAIIHHVLGRKSVFERKAAGSHNEVQVIAANMDTVFICMSLNEDFNLRRLERYISIALDSRANPVIVLTKADLCKDLETKLNEVSQAAAGNDIIVCSSAEEDGLKEILPYICQGQTIVFLGSSGVGKSTIINRLMGEEVLKTREIRDSDGKGKHTTTHRQMLLLPSGAIVVDTPGMRELYLDSADLSKSFEDVESLAVQCKYTDCSHNGEPGCAVRDAIDKGTLSEGRFNNYKKLQIELSYKGMSSKQIENQKIKRMFGSKNKMKRFKNYVNGKK